MCNKIFCLLFILPISAFRTYGQQTPQQDTRDLEAPDSNNLQIEIFAMVEQMPVFSGGEQAMYKFLSDSIRYPKQALEENIEGKVYVRFVVSSEGDIINVEVLRGLTAGLSEEAVRVIKLMPKWIPGKQNGKNVSVYFTIPILFKLK